MWKAAPDHTSPSRIRTLLANGKSTIFSRGRFGFNQRKRQKLLDKLKDYNEMLHKMLDRYSGTRYSTTTSYSLQKEPIPHSGLRERFRDVWRAIKTLLCRSDEDSHSLRLALARSLEAEDRDGAILIDMFCRCKAWEHDSTQRWASSTISIPAIR